MWTDAEALEDVRAKLSDGNQDKFGFRKPCFGLTNGDNTTFKTFEWRRVTDLTDTEFPLGVFVNGESVSVSEDFPDTGDFQLSDAPVDGDKVEASYYSQWFSDDELRKFLVKATQWLGMGRDFTTLQDVIIPAALEYAASEAYAKLALRWAVRVSEMYRVEDAPDEKRMAIVDSYKAAATQALKDATEKRDAVYTRQGQSLAPLFRNIAGHVVDPQPKR